MRLPKKFPPIKGFTRPNFAKQKLVGFTLIELLVVIAILGILVTIGINLWQRAVVNARDQTRRHDLNQVNTALEFHFEHNGCYPLSSVSDINCFEETGDPLPRSISWGTGEFRCLGFTYMRQLPDDPIATPTRNYCYIHYGPNFELWTVMENHNNSNTGDSPGVGRCVGTGYNYIIISSN